ncbi:MAG: hypothetical protein K9N55_18705 [Phycisphaerae bacterium]|nr:hypothetical protein [Phycisphaerae bacterium]
MIKWGKCDAGIVWCGLFGDIMRGISHKEENILFILLFTFTGFAGVDSPFSGFNAVRTASSPLFVLSKVEGCTAQEDHHNHAYKGG